MNHFHWINCIDTRLKHQRIGINMVGGNQGFSNGGAQSHTPKVTIGLLVLNALKNKDVLQHNCGATSKQ